MFIITIDSGTTNSRLRLIEEKQQRIADHLKIPVGIRNTAIDGHNEQLKKSILEGIKNLISRNNLSAQEIRYMVASGMITSNLGLFEVPHVPSPATVHTFAKHVQVQFFAAFPDIPCLFIPGMKNRVEINEVAQEEELVVSLIPQDKAQNEIKNETKNEIKNETDKESQEQVLGFEQLNAHDVMRGEEVETIGILQQLQPEGKGIVILPGSHIKYILVNEHNELQFSVTTLSGEMLHALSSETILAHSLEKELITSIDREWLLAGYRQGQRLGITRVLFHVRLLHLLAHPSSNQTGNQRANYFAGCILSSDIHMLEELIDHEQPDWIVLGGSNPLRGVLATILAERNFGPTVIEATEEQVELSTSLGAIYTAENYFRLNRQK